MFSRKKSLIFATLWLCMLAAGGYAADNIQISPSGPINTALPRDAYLSPLSTNGSDALGTASLGYGLNCITNGAPYMPLYQWVVMSDPSTGSTGLQIGGQTLFKTNVAGIGYTMTATAIGSGSKSNVPIQSGDNLIREWNTNLFGCTGLADKASFQIQVKFYTTGEVITAVNNQSINIHLANVFRVTQNTKSSDMGNLAYSVDGQHPWASDFYLTATISTSLATCSVQSPTNQTIDLGVVSKAALESNSTMSPVGSASFTLQCPSSPIITAKASLSDANQPGNTSDILSTESGTGMAQGVGVQVLRQGSTTALKLRGQDTSLGTADTTVQWALDNPTSTNPSITLQGRYVRTGIIDPGIVKAVANITFSYQ